MSVANKQQAEECLKLARKYYSEGNAEKAKKFATKSARLFPSHAAEQLLKDCEKGVPKPSPNSNSSSPSGKSRASAGGPSPTAASPKVEPIKQTGPPKLNYKPEQLAEVKKIRSLKDYYEILGVAKDAAENDIKKAYKKLAIRFHPDKNHAPGAEEAFKSISSAYQCLTDPEKRKMYDRYGTEDLTGAGSQQFRSQFHQEELSPEELFSMFFGGGPMHPGRRRSAFHFQRAPRRHRSEQHSNESPFLSNIINLLPLLIVLLFSFMNMTSNSDVPFRLERSTQYPVERTTDALNIPYYVDKYFSHYYGRDARAVRQVESLVEKEFFSDLKTKCASETREKKMKIKEAKRYRGADQPTKLRRAHDISTKSCDTYDQFYAKAS